MGYADDLLFLVRHYTSCTNIASWGVSLVRPSGRKAFWVLKEEWLLSGDHFYLPVLNDGDMHREEAAKLARRYIEGDRLPLWD